MPSDRFENSVRVAVYDAKTGEELESRVISNDYLLVCVGKRYLKNVQVMGRTHMLAVASDWPVIGK